MASNRLISEESYHSDLLHQLIRDNPVVSKRHGKLAILLRPGIKSCAKKSNSYRAPAKKDYTG